MQHTAVNAYDLDLISYASWL